MASASDRKRRSDDGPAGCGGPAANSPTRNLEIDPEINGLSAFPATDR